MANPPSHYNDTSVFRQLRNSSAGQFQQAHADHGQTGCLSLVCCKLPTIVVVGDTKVGKSSVLSRMTRCAVFHGNSCTKMPVRVQLVQVPVQPEQAVSVTFQDQRSTFKTVQHASAEVDRIMQATSGICADEILVVIEQGEVPSCEIIDLPGIRVFPAEESVSSTALLSRYVRDANTIVLCVVDAASTSLCGSRALKKVREMNKLPQTILVLSKSDLVKSEPEAEKRIFDPLLGESADSQYLDGLAGCVAVANCHLQSNIDAIDVDQSVEEQHTFSFMLRDPAAAYAAQDTRRQLTRNMTVGQLIVRLDSMYHDHVTQQWAPRAMHRCRKSIQVLLQQIDALGPAPEALQQEDIVTAIRSQVDYSFICQRLRGMAIAIGQAPHTTPLSSYHMPDVQWGTEAWSDALVAYEPQLEAAVDAFLSSTICLQTVQKAFKSAAQLSPLQLRRFVSLRKLLSSQLAPDCIAASKVAATPLIKQMQQAALLQLHCEYPAEDTFQKLDSGIHGCLIKHVVYAVKNTHFQLPSDFRLAEADDRHTSRLQLNADLQQQQSLLACVEHVDVMINPEACGPHWYQAVRQTFSDASDGNPTADASTEPPTRAADWSDVDETLHRQQSEHEVLGAFTTALVPVDPAGEELSMSAMDGSHLLAGHSQSTGSPTAAALPPAVMDADVETQAGLESILLTPTSTTSSAHDSEYSFIETHHQPQEDYMDLPFAL